jgi:NAD(P)H-hydrate epimerase
MSFLSATSVRDLDAAAIRDGTPGTDLMARACRALADEVLFLMEHRRGSVLICAGPGNNGGDGFGLALHLQQSGVPVDVWVAAGRERVTGDARVFLEAAEGSGVSIHFRPDAAEWSHPPLFCPPYALLVDALLGTGSRSAPEGVLAAAILALKTLSSQAPLFAVDLPSGLNPDTGLPFDPTLCLQADFTLTLAAAKLGFSHDASAEWTGSVTVLDLGFSESDLALHAEGVDAVMDLRQARRLLLPPAVDTHKGRQGHLAVIGGSSGMCGAPVLSSRAALRSGAGLVTLFGPPLCSAAAHMYPELMTRTLNAGKKGTLCEQPLDLGRANAVLLGPGMSVDEDTRAFTRVLLRTWPGPTVLDASALGVLAGLPEPVGPSRVLTPHPGEMSLLLGLPLEALQQDRAGAVDTAIRRSGSTVVLKGPHTRIGSPTGARWINLNGNPGLATAGSGDVLGGILGALLAKGLSPEHAAPLAVFLHGRAGDVASMRKGRSGMCSGDVIDAMPSVLHHLQGR